MKELGPAEFSAATGLSVKALRLYDERGLLVPGRVDRATGYRRYAEDQIATGLEAAYPGERELLLVAEESGSVAGAAMGFVSSGSEVTLRMLAVAAGRRRQGIGRALLRAFEASALRLGATRISLGADAEAGFYVRHGYQTILLLQWAYDPGRFGAEVEALAAGPVKEMTWRRDCFGGVPSCSWISTNRARSCEPRSRTWFAERRLATA